MSNIAISAAVQLAQLGAPGLITTKKRGLFNIQIQAAPPALNTLPDIVAMITIEESHNDSMVITEHPVQVGAAITDYAYKLPANLTLKLGWSNSPNNNLLLSLEQNLLATFGGQAGQAITNIGGILSAGYNLFSSQDQLEGIYNQLLALQYQKAIFDIYTGKRTYKNMMLAGISTVTNSFTANSMPITLECQEVILVNTQVLTITKEQLDASHVTLAGSINKGTVPLNSPNGTPTLNKGG